MGAANRAKSSVIINVQMNSPHFHGGTTFALLAAALAFTWGCSSATPPVSPSTSLGLTVTAVLPDGKPAAGALGVLFPGTHQLMLSGLKIDNDPTYQRCLASKDGDLHFAGMDHPYWLVVLDPAGCACLSNQAITPGQQVLLRPWAHIHGRFTVGKNPAPGMQLGAAAFNIGEDNLPHVYAIIQTVTDSHGEFTIDKIPPGNLEIMRSVTLKFHGIPYAAAAAEQRDFSANPGQTVEVDFGGTGRPVVGRVQIPPELADRKDWEFTYAIVSTPEHKPVLPMPQTIKNSPLATQQHWYKNFIQTPAGKSYLTALGQQWNVQRHLVSIARDGAFKAEDVPAGDYSLGIEVYGKSAPSPRGVPIAGCDHLFTVPPIPGGRSDVPLDIGTVELELEHPVHVPEVGDPAPQFTVETLDGKPLSLSDFRGKYLLLEFWTTWCAPCRAEVPNLKAIFAHFGKDPRFAMLSLSVDDSPFLPKSFVDRENIAWPQGYCQGAWDSPVLKAYNADQYGVPSMWLIAPNGTILARPDPRENTDQLWRKIAKDIQHALATPARPQDVAIPSPSSP